MGPAANDVVDDLAINLEARFLGQVAVERRRIHLQDFWFDESGFGGEVGADLIHLLLHRLIGTDASVEV